jgi:deoxyribodipyrimidine photo-lyase
MTVSASAVIYWFRNDLRVTDNPAFAQACQKMGKVLGKVFAVYVHDPKHDDLTRWGFKRMSAQRKTFLAARLQDLAMPLKAMGCELTELHGSPKEALSAFCESANTNHIHCEDIAAPEEQADVAALKAAGFDVETHWQSSLLEPADLPFEVQDLPAVFTAFRLRRVQQPR